MMLVSWATKLAEDREGGGRSMGTPEGSGLLVQDIRGQLRVLIVRPKKQ